MRALSGTCKLINLANVREACGTLNGDAVLCSAARCDTEAKKCVAFSKLGEVCDEAKGLRCELPGDCVEGKCLVPDPSTCK